MTTKLIYFYHTSYPILSIKAEPATLQIFEVVNTTNCEAEVKPENASERGV